VAGKIGVLALQGDVSEHIHAFHEAGSHLGIPLEIFPVRDADQVEGLDALVIPGGESTTICRLIDKNSLRDAIRNFQGGIFATCAGMVIIATSIIDDNRFRPLGILDITVRRNAFGRQKDSFEADIDVFGLETPFHAVFIRAPVAISAGSGTDVIAEYNGGIVGVRRGKVLALAFHPELSGDRRLHTGFLERLGIS
jgi:5'-phosphate synthase pdxT subunit